MKNQMIIYHLKISALRQKCPNTSFLPVVMNIIPTFSFLWDLHRSYCLEPQAIKTASSLYKEKHQNHIMSSFQITFSILIRSGLDPENHTL